VKPHPVESAWQQRPLGNTVLRTYRSTVDLDDVSPNPNQPRMGDKRDPELQRQIEANQGIFEPLLVEPDPDRPGRFRIIDGERRWTNARILVYEQNKPQFKELPVEITDKTLSDEDRLRTWIYIHRQRKEWDAREKEMVASRLVDLVGRASAANILGITVRELDKLVDIYELSTRLTNLREPGASITWAREIKNLNRALLTPEVLDAIVEKVNSNYVTNSKDIRKLRVILKDPEARDEFLFNSGSIDKAILRVPEKGSAKEPLVKELESLAIAIRNYSWAALNSLKGNPDVLEKISDTEGLLKELRNALSAENPSSRQ
jgi:ParB family transcriptional regulator, chromosome partitioning protein